jgi:hypothetical protein
LALYAHTRVAIMVSGMKPPLTPEQRRAPEVRRDINRQHWRRSEANANAAWQREQTAIAPEIACALGREGGALGALRKVMADTEAPLHLRLSAAESVLAFEIPRAGLAGRNADEAGSVAYEFLCAVSEAAATPPALRLKALKLRATVESIKAQPHDPFLGIGLRLDARKRQSG